MQTHSRRLAWAAAGLIAVGGVAGWSAPALLHTARAAETSVTLATPASNVTPGPIPLGTAPNYRAIVAQNHNAVVGIISEGETKVASRQQPFGGQNPFGDDDDNPLSQFFRHMPHQRQGNVPTRAQGSGFIISPDGLILTNAHVVDGSKLVTVKLIDHREFKAKVLGADKTSDIAVLKIDAHNLPVVRIGDSDQLKVGDYVLAIGAPFGLEETATAGIVSATARSLPGDGSVPFIQTDAAVNPGNSGGPLFDSTGAVVGINSQIYSNSGGYQGVSFAIPIALAQQIKDQIVKTGKVEHGRLGVEVQDLDQSLADSFKLKEPGGALVSKVEPQSAADKAGLRSGDVILKYDGVSVTDAGQLSARVSMAAPGKEAEIQISRDGQAMTLHAKVGSATQVADNDSSGDASDKAQLGLALRPLTPDERQQAGVSSGLVVEDAQGRAAAAGIQPGDVVLSVNGTEVKSVPQLRDFVQKHDKQIALLIMRGDNRLFVPIGLG